MRAVVTDPNISTAEVLRAYRDCRKRKRGADTTTEFEIDLVHNLVTIARHLGRGTWRPGTSMCFAVTTPKPREVWAGQFADRVVHHVIYNRLRPRFEPRFIPTTFACIPGRGTLAARQWAERALRRVTAGWTRPAWVLQMDVKNFFTSIDRHLLLKILLPKVHEPWLATATERVFLHDVRIGAHFPGDPAKLDLVPRHKSLWHAPPGKGLPIGNLTSQFAANVLMDPLDQHIVRSLKPFAYGRYVDDLLLVDTDRDRLEWARDEIAAYAHHIQRLTMHPDKTRLAPADRGVDFVGAYMLPHRTYLRRATVRRGTHAILEADIDDLLATANSYLGIAAHADTYRLRGKWARMATGRGLVSAPDRSKMLTRPKED